jgi:hypothetical protein
MSHHEDNVRPLICPQVRRYRGPGHVAQVIRLHRPLHPLRPWRAIVLAIATAILIAASLAVMLRARNEIMGQLIPMSWW